MRAINADTLVNFHVQCSNGKDYVLLPYKSLSEVPTVDVVPRSVYEQIKWERDIAMQQLEENEIAFGEKSKVGKWVYDHWCEFKCSECGHFSSTEPRGREKYCPNCGCIMENGGWENEIS